MRLVVERPDEVGQVRVDRGHHLIERQGPVVAARRALPAWPEGVQRADRCAAGVVDRQRVIEVVEQHPAGNRRVTLVAAFGLAVEGAQPAKLQARRLGDARRQDDLAVVGDAAVGQPLFQTLGDDRGRRRQVHCLAEGVYQTQLADPQFTGAQRVEAVVRQGRGDVVAVDLRRHLLVGEVAHDQRRAQGIHHRQLQALAAHQQALVEAVQALRDGLQVKIAEDALEHGVVGVVREVGEPGFELRFQVDLGTPGQGHRAGVGLEGRARLQPGLGVEVEPVGVEGERAGNRVSTVVAAVRSEADQVVRGKLHFPVEEGRQPRRLPGLQADRRRRRALQDHAWLLGAGNTTQGLLRVGDLGVQRRGRHCAERLAAAAADELAGQFRRALRVEGQAFGEQGVQFGRVAGAVRRGGQANLRGQGGAVQFQAADQLAADPAREQAFRVETAIAAMARRGLGGRLAGQQDHRVGRLPEAWCRAGLDLPVGAEAGAERGEGGADLLLGGGDAAGTGRCAGQGLDRGEVVVADETACLIRRDVGRGGHVELQQHELGPVDEQLLAQRVEVAILPVEAALQAVDLLQLRGGGIRQLAVGRRRAGALRGDLAGYPDGAALQRREAGLMHRLVGRCCTTDLAQFGEQALLEHIEQGFQIGHAGVA